jgi:ribosomal protein L40E
MKCPKCQTKNPETVNFCGECQTKLEKVCPNCNHLNPPQFKFCNKCSSNLTVTQKEATEILNLEAFYSWGEQKICVARNVSSIKGKMDIIEERG